MLAICATFLSLAALVLSLAKSRYLRTCSLAVLNLLPALARNLLKIRPALPAAASSDRTKPPSSPLSLGCGIAASCAVRSATTTLASAKPSLTACSTTPSLISFTPSSPINWAKSWIVVKSGVQSVSVSPHRYRAGA